MKDKKVTAVDVPMGEDKWRVESDMRTLMDAAEIKADPKRYAAAMKMARDKAAKLQKFTNTK